MKITLKIRPERCLVAFCDEASSGDRYFVLGALYFAYSDSTKSALGVVEVERELAEIKMAYGLRDRVKWGKVPSSRGQYFEGYKALLEKFLGEQLVYFKCMIVDTQSNPLDNRKLWGGDPLVGYLKFYCVFLADGLMQRYPGYYYDIAIDDYAFREGCDCKVLQQSVEGRYIRKVAPESALYHCAIRTCDERESNLLQLTDLLVGAVAFAWNGGEQRDSARAEVRLELVDLIEKRLGLSLAKATAWSALKFNIWRLQPKLRPVAMMP